MSSVRTQTLWVYQCCRYLSVPYVNWSVQKTLNPANMHDHMYGSSSLPTTPTHTPTHNHTPTHTHPHTHPPTHTHTRTHTPHTHTMSGLHGPSPAPSPVSLSCVPLLRPSSASLSLPMQHKVWLKPSAEQSYLYGNHILKSGLGRITENTPQYQGVVMYSMSDIPLVGNGS